MVKPTELSLAFVKQPGGQRGGKPVGAAFAMEQHQRAGIGTAGLDVQAQRQQGAAWQVHDL